LNLISSGEPAISDKINSFVSAVSTDMNIISKQLDYQSAQIASTYNIFNTEIDKETSIAQRIKSKVSILQMYSTSPGNDLYYIGDSFDNFDYIDITKVKANRVPNISGGSLKLSSRNTIQWRPNYISVIEDDSNGFIGSNHAVYNTDNVTSNTRYYFEDNIKIGYIPGVIDGNPLTHFEYEAISVSPADKEQKGAKNYEFLYSRRVKENNRDVTKYYDWSDHLQTSPLKLGLSLTSTKPQKFNTITIEPNFGNQNVFYPEVKIVKITAIDSNSNSEITLSSESLYIGSTVSPQSIEASRNYFYEKATVNFPEVTTSKINVYFEQPNSYDTKIKHLYWKPVSLSQNSLFVNQQRFNPEGLYSSGYEAVNYGINTIIPPIEEPIKFKSDSNITTKSINVSARKSGIQENVFVISFKRLNSANVLQKHYLLSQYPAPTYQPLDVQYTRSATTEVATAIKFASTEDAESVKLFIQNQFTTSTSSQKIYNWDASKFQELTVESHIEYRDKDFRETVALQPMYELYDAKRWVISLKSIEAHYDVYNSVSEIVSKPYEFPYDVRNLMITSEFDNNSTSASVNSIKYYVSLDDGSNWIQISPVENAFSGVPEILSFNENISGSFQIPGVSYFNYPQIPKEVRKIRVKIEINKPSNSNISPTVYSYKLCTKVEQL